MKKPHRSPGELTVHVKGRNLPVTAAMRDQIEGKMSRLDKYLDRLQVIDVEVWTEKAREASSHNHVEASTHVRGKTIRVQTSHEDMYAAVDEAVDKLYRQINRHKEKIKDHHGAKASDALFTNEVIDDTPEPLLNGVVNPQIRPELEIERLELEPMFVDEAAEELRASGYSFYVFLNARNEHINVLYCRRDGKYGLIEPRAG